MPANDLTTFTQNDLAAHITAGFAELNRRTAEHNRKVVAARRMGMGWITPAQIDDAPLMELLDAVVSWDDDAKGTLAELRFQSGVDADGFALTDCFGLDVNSAASRNASRAFDGVGQ